MRKRITAFIAALLLSVSVFSACGKNSENDNNVTDNEVNVIVDGSEVATDAPEPNGDGAESIEPAEDDDIPPEATSTTTVGEFLDPGLQFINEDDIEEDETTFTQTEAPAVTTAPPSSEELESILSSIQEAAQNTTTRAPIMKEYNIDYTTRYGYNQLNAAEKELYGKILEGVKSVNTRVEVDDSISDEMWIKVYGCVYNQEPQLFWLASKKVKRGMLWYWEVDPETITSMQKEIDNKVGTIIAQAEGKSDYEKLKVFHDYISLNNNFVKSEGYNETIYGGFVTGEIQCSGYARTMQYLCDLAGIESMVVTGSNESGDTHAWNVVKVDGQWYNIDTTWDDPILSNVDETNVRYRYFLVPDSWIHNKSHFNVNKKITGTQVTYFTPPACTSETMNYFNVTKQLYSDKSSADSALREAMKKTADSKKRAAEIRVSTKQLYDEITGNLSEYASWIKKEKPSVTSVTSNCDPNTLVIELDLIY